MILYHGTSMELGEKIIQEGKIRCQIARNYKDYGKSIAGTTDGFVYLTKNLYTAYYYGNILLLEQDDLLKKYIYIFKIEMSDDTTLLEPDFDELLQVEKIAYSNNITWKKSLEICGCVRIRRDIIITGLEYIKLPATWNLLENEKDLEICRKLSKMQVNYKNDCKEVEKEVEDRWIWEKIDK